MLAPILDIKNLSVFSNESPLLQNISFSLKKYSILGIIGESGSGKSLTALSILNILKYIAGPRNKRAITLKNEGMNTEF